MCCEATREDSPYLGNPHLKLFHPKLARLQLGLAQYSAGLATSRRHILAYILALTTLTSFKLMRFKKTGWPLPKCQIKTIQKKIHLLLLCYELPTLRRV